MTKALTESYCNNPNYTRERLGLAPPPFPTLNPKEIKKTTVIGNTVKYTKNQQSITS